MTIQEDKLRIIDNLVFGQRVAEDEPRLEDYFVETPLWRKIIRGEVDIVYGMKGSGKSAIFHLLTSGKDTPNDVILIPAENPRGTPIFSGIKLDPPTSETEFIYLWKLYIFSLIINQPSILEKFQLVQPELFKELKRVGVIDDDKSEILKNALKYVSSVSIPNILEVGISSGTNQENKRINIEKSFVVLSEILEKSGMKVWVAFDRLDSVFDENLTLEENALRALFKAYLDLLKYRSVQLKIFLRTDIWKRLTTKGFREASHITRSDTIEWSENNIVNLISRRILNNPAVLGYYQVRADDVIGEYGKQLKLIFDVFPEQIDAGEKKPDSVKWMISRVSDGSKQVAPRELIHLLNQTKDEQIKSLELGETPPDGKKLFSSIAIKKALPTVSKTRLEQTLFAEYPEMKEPIMSLEGEKTQHSIESLSGIWNTLPEKANELANKLVEIGFFELRGEKNAPEFWIPFIYRPALNLIQGKAES